MKPPKLAVPNIKKIPPFSVPDKPLTATTQAQIPIVEIADDIVLYKDGGAALILESTSLNFGLLSEKEQEAVIVSYAALLNSLTFSIQISVRSQKKDISSYLSYLDIAYAKIQNPQLQFLMQGYKRFISETIKKKNVLGKRFFIIIPFSNLELGVTKTLVAFGKRKGPLPFSKSYVVKKARITLYPRRDHIIRQANRLGLKLRQLSDQELIELFYGVYNPAPPPRANVGEKEIKK